VSLRTQQIILEESGIASTIDPLGGSFAIEALTDEIESEARSILEQIDDLGGTVACIESGWLQQQIADSAYDFQRAKERGERVIVGVNAYRDAGEDGLPLELHRVHPETEERKISEIAAFKGARSEAAVAERLEKLQRAAESDENLMPETIEAVRSRATGGEIVEALRAVFGSYVETVVF
ncbi:MAG TPA: methylmalonyl-CoA mutase family protein, partial [Gaiellaceae bacterium]|nr:methylmalonyl-CoA mutase family protein [Gaiellaceae bacterium]